MRHATSALGTLLALAAALACGGGGGSNAPAATSTPPVPIAVTLDQPTASITVQRQRAFSALVSGSANTAVTWSVQEGSAGGSVDANGLYTAPAGAGTYHLVARSAADPTRSATAVLTVVPAPTITSFTASPGEIVPGADTTVSFTFTDGTGVLNPGMTPVTSGSALMLQPSSSTVYVLSVTNSAGTTVAAGASVTVSGQVAVGVLPGTATVAQGTTQQFQALVSGTSNGAVTWSLQEGAAGGMMGSDGGYTPPPYGGTFHVVATSVLDPSKHAVATVTVPRAWQPMMTLSDPSQIAIAPQLQGNDAGDLMAFYVADGTLTTRFLSGTTNVWGSEQPIAAVTAYTSGPLAPDGTCWALYVEATNLKARHWNGSSWDTPEVVYTTPSATMTSLSLATEPGGTAIASWLEIQTFTHVRAATRSSGTWSFPPQTLDLYSTAPTNLRAALTPGLGWITWVQNDGTYNQIYTARWTSGAIDAATARTSVPPSGYPQYSSGPSLAMKADGTTSLLFMNLPSAGATPALVGTTYTPGSGWGSILAQQSSPGAITQYQQAARGSKLIRAWAQTEGSGYSLNADGVSLAPFTLANPTGAMFGVDMASNGKALFVWQEYGHGDVPNRILAALYDHGTLTWGAPQALATFTTIYSNNLAAAAADGRAATCWSVLPAGAAGAQVQVRQFR